MANSMADQDYRYVITQRGRTILDEIFHILRSMIPDIPLNQDYTRHIQQLEDLSFGIFDVRTASQLFAHLLSLSESLTMINKLEPVINEVFKFYGIAPSLSPGLLEFRRPALTEHAKYSKADYNEFMHRFKNSKYAELVDRTTGDDNPVYDFLSQYMDVFSTGITIFAPIVEELIRLVGRVDRTYKLEGEDKYKSSTELSALMSKFNDDKSIINLFLKDIIGYRELENAKKYVEEWKRSNAYEPSGYRFGDTPSNRSSAVDENPIYQYFPNDETYEYGSKYSIPYKK